MQRNRSKRYRAAAEQVDRKKAYTINDAVATLNAVLAEHARPPRLERAGREWRFSYGPDESAGILFLAAPTAVGLLETIRDHGLSRFGRCTAHPCRCVFVDRSRNRSRRYCCDLCADRANQQAARRRRQAQTTRVR